MTPAGAAAPTVASSANISTASGTRIQTSSPVNLRTASTTSIQTSSPSASGQTQPTTILPGTSDPPDRSFWSRVRQILGHIANVTTFCNSFVGVVFTVATFFALGITGYQYNIWSKAMAVWNADKIFQDGCRTRQQQGLELLEDCRRALDNPLSAPPGSSFNLRKRADNSREIASELQLLVLEIRDWALEWLLAAGSAILCLSFIFRRQLVLFAPVGILTPQTWLTIIGTVFCSAALRMLTYSADPLTASIFLGVLFTGTLMVFTSSLVPIRRTESAFDIMLNQWARAVLSGVFLGLLAIHIVCHFYQSRSSGFLNYLCTMIVMPSRRSRTFSVGHEASRDHCHTNMNTSTGAC